MERFVISGGSLLGRFVIKGRFLISLGSFRSAPGSLHH